MSKETIKIVEIDTNPAVKSIKDLRKELKEFKDQMANLEEGSDEFLEIANKAGEVKHQLDEINESIKGASSDFGDMVGNISNVTAGLVGAFSAISGGLQALGLKNEAIDESIKKMQGLMAVVQGLGQIDTAIKSLNKLQKSITATTGAAKLLKAALQPKVFLAISAAIAGVVAIYSKLKSKQEEAAEAQKKLNEKIKEENLLRQKQALNKDLKSLSNEVKISYEIELLKNNGDEIAASKAVLTQQEQLLNDLTTQYQNWWNSIPEISKKMKKNKGMTDQEIMDFFFPIKAEEVRSKTAQTEEAIAEFAQQVSNLERLAEAKKLYGKEEKDTSTKSASEIEAEQLAKANAALDLRIEKLQHSGETEKKIIEETIKIENERLELYEVGSKEYEQTETKIFNLKEKEAELTKSITKEELERQLAKAEYKLEGEKLLERQIELQQQYLNTLEDESTEYYNQQRLIKGLQEELAELNETTDGNLEKRKDYLRSVADEYLMIEKRELNTIDEYNRVFAELEEARKLDLISEEEHLQAKERLREIYNQNVLKSTLSLVSASSSMITGILDNIASQQDKTNKEGFEKSKKLQIASATIQMLTGIATALAGAFTTKTGPWDIALAAIQAGTIATSGILNINKIKNTKFDGGGASAGTSASAVSATIMPPVQYSNAVQGAQTESAIQNQRVFVVESDISDTMKAVVTQSDENTY